VLINQEPPLTAYVMTELMTMTELFVTIAKKFVPPVTVNTDVPNVLILPEVYPNVNVLKENTKSMLQPVENVTPSAKPVSMIPNVPVVKTPMPTFLKKLVYVLIICGWMNPEFVKIVDTHVLNVITLLNVLFVNNPPES